MSVVSLITCLVLLLLASICSSNGNTSDDYLEHISVNAGEPATLICDLPEKYSNKRADFYGPTGRLLLTKSNEDDNEPAGSDRTRFLLEHTYAWTWSLILSDASDDDAGEYTCRISSSSIDEQTTIKRYNLTVLTPPKILDMTVESTSTGLIRENEQIVLRCLARGIPQPKISWHIPGKKLFNSRRNDRNLLAVDNRLIIKNLSRTSPIDYQCIADNGIPPRDTRTKRLLPSIAPEMTIQSSIISSRLLLNCTIIARPLNSAKWKRHRTEIPHIKRVQINDYTVELLLVLELTASSMDSAFGMYECEAENQFKVSKAFVNIDDTILLNTTSTMTTTSSLPKQQRRVSSASYAQVELLLNQSAICRSHWPWLLVLFLSLILVNYSNGFYHQR